MRVGEGGLCRVTLAISTSKSSAGEEAAGGLLNRAKEAWPQPLPVPLGPKAAAAGDLKDAARSAARRQRLLGAACSLGALPKPRLRGAAASDAARPAGASPVAVRRSAVMAVRPGIAAGCFSICSSWPSSCTQHG